MIKVVLSSQLSTYSELTWKRLRTSNSALKYKKLETQSYYFLTKVYLMRALTGLSVPWSVFYFRSRWRNLGAAAEGVVASHGQNQGELRAGPELAAGQPTVCPRLSCQRSQAGFQHRFITFRQGCGSGSEVDPDSIGYGKWIRIRIRNPDPDPGGQKWPTKVEKIKKLNVLKC